MNQRNAVHRFLPHIEALYRLDSSTKVGVKYSFNNSTHQAQSEAGIIHEYDQNERTRKALRESGKPYFDDPKLQQKNLLHWGARLQNWHPNGRSQLTFNLSGQIENYSYAQDQWQKGVQVLSWLPSSWTSENSYIYRLQEGRIQSAQDIFDGKRWWSNVPYPKHDLNVAVHWPITLSRNFNTNQLKNFDCTLE